MPDLEVLPYEAARAAFRDAFWKAHEQALAEVAAGGERSSELVLPFLIEVPREDITNDRWHGHVARFEEAGRLAAFASKRGTRLFLVATQSRPDHPLNRWDGLCRWYVSATA